MCLEIDGYDVGQSRRASSLYIIAIILKDFSFNKVSMIFNNISFNCTWGKNKSVMVK